MTKPTRDQIDRALINVISNAMNYPDPFAMLGKDTGPLRKKCVDAVAALLDSIPDDDLDVHRQRLQELEGNERMRYALDLLEHDPDAYFRATHKPTPWGYRP